MPVATGVAVVGTTASGKSALALEGAQARRGVEILSIDSMCVYRGMDIATAKPGPAARAAVPHHMLDLVDPSEEFTVADFQVAARRAMAEIAERHGVPLLVGGTGLHLRAVIDGLALPGRWPELAARLDEEASGPGGTEALHARLEELDPLGASRILPTNRRRVVRALEVTLGAGRPFSSFGPGLGTYPPTDVTLLGLPFDRPTVDRRIAERLAAWMDEGLLEEVRGLARRPGGLSRTARQALGYRELLRHVEDGASLAECVEEAIRRTRAYARRQWAWWRRDPRVRWVPPNDDPRVALAGVLDQAADGRLERWTAGTLSA